MVSYPSDHRDADHGLLSPWALVHQIRRAPLTALLVLGGAAAALLGLGIGFWWLTSPAMGDLDQFRSSQALEHLRNEEFRDARKIAAQILVEADPEYDDIGTALFVLGECVARDAEEAINPDQARELYLTAARYLEESRKVGFPAIHEAQALALLGRCLYKGKAYARSLPVLEDAVTANPTRQTPLHFLLAESYALVDPPDFQRSLDHCNQFLSDRMLEIDQRERGLLIKGRALLSLGKWEDCLHVVEEIPFDSPLAPQGILIQGQVYFRRAAAIRDQKNPEEADLGRNLLAQAASKFETILESGNSDLGVLQTAHYLLGRCRLLQENRSAAETQFSLARRLDPHSAQGVAAAVGEADLQRAAGHEEEAFTSYLRVLVEASDTEQYRNPWMSQSELQSRFNEAYLAYRQSGRFEQALQLAKAMESMVPRHRSLELAAMAHEQWGKHLWDEAEKSLPSAAATLEEKARFQMRRAGEYYARLALLRKDSPQYIQDLGNSAEAYLKGHDFDRAARLWQTYLKQSPRTGRARGLVALAEARFSQGDIESCIHNVDLCLEDFPKDPVSYDARLLAAKAHQELGEPEKAKKLLVQNLYEEALTPKSDAYRDSLFALGDLLAAEGDRRETTSRNLGVVGENAEEIKGGLEELEKAYNAYQEAIEVLTDAVERYPTRSEAVLARYQIAQSHRQAAKWPQTRLQTISIETTRVALNRQLRGELEAAIKQYGSLREFLNTKQEESELTPAEQRILRNCYFAEADSYFDLGQYEDAINAYLTATNRYQHEPESLEAFVQIASCHRRLNRHSLAQGTIQRAKVVLAGIPPEADFEATTRYTRDEWNALLNWLGSL